MILTKWKDFNAKYFRRWLQFWRMKTVLKLYLDDNSTIISQSHEKSNQILANISIILYILIFRLIQVTFQMIFTFSNFAKFLNFDTSLFFNYSKFFHVFEINFSLENIHLIYRAYFPKEKRIHILLKILRNVLYNRENGHFVGKFYRRKYKVDDLIRKCVRYYQKMFDTCIVFNSRFIYNKLRQD